MCSMPCGRCPCTASVTISTPVRHPCIAPRRRYTQNPSPAVTPAEHCGPPRLLFHTREPPSWACTVTSCSPLLPQRTLLSRGRVSSGADSARVRVAADALVAGMQQVAQPQLMLLRAKPSADYQTFPWVAAPPPLPPLDTAGAWGERYRVARMHDLTLGAHRHPLLYGCVVPSASSAPKAVRPPPFSLRAAGSALITQ